jgi:hypothetical protein
MLTPSFAFKYRAPISASAALATTMRRIVDKVSTAPCFCSPFIGLELTKEFPPALLFASGSFKYPAGVDVQDHIACVVADCRIGMVGTVVN